MEPGLRTLFEHTAKLRLLTATEELELARRRDRGDHEAVKKLVEHNIRLAVWRAKRWQNRGLPLEDLIQEGVFGLERAAQKFDPDRGIRFSTYATNWCDHFMQRAVGREDIVPHTVRRRRLEADKLMKEGLALEEVAKRLKCKPADIVEAIESWQVAVSLDGDGDAASLYERLAADDGEPDELTLRVRGAVGELPPDERGYIVRRYGMEDRPVQSRADVARELGITTGEAAALEARAVKRLREVLADLERALPPSPCIDLGPEDMEVICRG